MGKGRKGQGNGIRPVITAREAGTRRPAGRRVPARTFSCLQLLRFIVFVGGTRGTVVVQLVAPSSCADQHAFLNEARAMLSVDFPGEVMRWNIAFGEACELLSEPQFFGAQLGNISPEFLPTQLIEYRGPNRF